MSSIAAASCLLAIFAAAEEAPPPAKIGFVVAASLGIADLERGELASAVTAALAKASGDKIEPVERDLAPPDCGTQPSCVKELAAKIGARDLVFALFIRGLKRTKIELQRGDGTSGAIVAQAQVEVEQAPESWPAALDPLAANLYPRTAVQVDSTNNLTTPAVKPETEEQHRFKRIKPGAVPPEPDKEETWKPWPYVAFGTAVALAAAGVGFGLASQSAYDEVEARPHPAMEVDDLISAGDNRAVAANVFYVGAVTAAIGGVVLLFVDD